MLSDEEEGRASHPRGKMRSVPKGAHNKRTRAVRDGGLLQQKVWLVMAAGGGKRVGEHNNQPKEGRTGHREPKRKHGNGSAGGSDGNCGGKGDGGGVCCGEVRGNDGNDDKDDDDNEDKDDDDDNDDNDGCGDVGGGCGDGDSGGEGDGGGNGCSECDGDDSNDSGCRSDGDGPQWLR